MSHFAVCLKKKVMRQKDAENVLYMSLVNFEANELDQTLVIILNLTIISFGDLFQILLIELLDLRVVAHSSIKQVDLSIRLTISTNNRKFSLQKRISKEGTLSQVEPKSHSRNLKRMNLPTFDNI